MLKILNLLQGLFEAFDYFEITGRYLMLRLKTSASRA